MTCSKISSITKKLGGKTKGALAAGKIKLLQSYYRKAIKRNSPDVAKMRKAILSTIYHTSSTDAKHNHSYCPTGPDSWCLYKRAVAKKEKPGSHNQMKLILSREVFLAILPV